MCSSDLTKEMDMDALAITDHGSMFGVVKFYKMCKKYGVKPIIGCEVYVSEKSHLRRDFKDRRYHLVLLAETQEGYHNLMKIVSESYVNGFYYKPRIDKDFLRSHSKGIIATSACLGGEVQNKIVQLDNDGAREAAREYADIFGPDNFFLEVQDHGMREQKLVNQELLKIHRETGLGMVATNDLFT